jgi:YhcH/YjgK/YiaL family protein
MIAMKKIHTVLILSIITVMGYSAAPDTTKIATIQEKNEWFRTGAWRGEFKALPDESIDAVAFYDHYEMYASLWTQVFNFLENTDLEQIETGNYTIAGDTVRVIVQEYVTQDMDERDYEAHRKYIDLQYLIRGKEYIGVADLNQYTSVVKSFDVQNDIGFYKVAGGELRMADDHVFFIFFPDNAHMPCIMAKERLPVKKVVFKIPANL